MHFRVPRKVDYELVLSLLIKRVIIVTEGSNPNVIKNGRVLKQRGNPRKRSESTDPRVDICADGRVMGVNVSYLVWMQYHQECLPINFQIHHVDEDSSNNDISNLVAVHKNDHHKLHRTLSTDDVPF